MKTACMALALICLCPAVARAAGDSVVATIDGEPVYATEIRDALELMPPAVRAEMTDAARRRQFIENYITWKLLLREASRRKIEESAEFSRKMGRVKNDILISVLQDNILAEVTAGDKEIRAFYNSHKAEFTKPETRRARHILVRDEKKAQDILKRLAGGAKFEAEARLQSEDKASAAEGGDIGWQTREDILPEFAKVLFSMKPGQTYDKPLKSRVGWHLVKLEGVKPPYQPEFTEIQDEVKARCIHERRLKTIPDLADRLKTQSTIQIIDDSIKTFGPARPAK